MPLKCMLDDQVIHSFDLDDRSWHQLRQMNRQENRLRMACCGSAVVPKANRFGTRYFTHARKGLCLTASESPAHLRAKEIIARAAQGAGWQVTTEHAGRAPGGEEWIADVLASQRSVSIALEVQLSRQSWRETVRRQARYRASGVRGIWLMRQLDCPADRETPAFNLAFDVEADRFEVRIAADDHYVLNPRMGADDASEDAAGAHGENGPAAPGGRLWQHRLGLTEFVAGALSGRLQWAPALGLRVPTRILVRDALCWRCKRPIRLVAGMVADLGLALPGHPALILTLDDFEACPEALQAWFSDAACRAHGLGRIGRRFSEPDGRHCLTNGCPHCDAAHGPFYTGGYLQDARLGFETEIAFSEPLVRALGPAAAGLQRWWFDTR